MRYWQNSSSSSVKKSSLLFIKSCRWRLSIWVRGRVTSEALTHKWSSASNVKIKKETKPCDEETQREEKKRWRWDRDTHNTRTVDAPGCTGIRCVSIGVCPSLRGTCGWLENGGLVRESGCITVASEDSGSSVYTPNEREKQRERAMQEWDKNVSWWEEREGKRARLLTGVVDIPPPLLSSAWNVQWDWDDWWTPTRFVNSLVGIGTISRYHSSSGGNFRECDLPPAPPMRTSAAYRRSKSGKHETRNAHDVATPRGPRGCWKGRWGRQRCVQVEDTTVWCERKMDKCTGFRTHHVACLNDSVFILFVYQHC